MKIKFLVGTGKYEKDHVEDYTDTIRSVVETLGLVEGKDFDLHGTEDEAREAENVERDAIDSIRTSILRQAANEAKQQVDRGAVEFKTLIAGDEPVDKDPNRGFRSLGDFGRAVYCAAIGPNATGHADTPNTREYQTAIKRLSDCQRAETRAVGSDEMQTVDGPQGAWLLPNAQRQFMLKGILEQGTLLPYVQQVPMTSQTVEMVSLDDYDHSSGTAFGGMQAYFVSEMAQKTASRPRVEYVELRVHDFVTLIPATKQMLKYSAVSLEPLLGTLAQQLMSWRIESYLFNGVGGMQPLGIINAASKIAVTPSVASQISAQDIRKMWTRILPSWRNDARWYINATMEEYLWNIREAIGTAGAHLYVPAGGYSAKPYDTIMGRPCVTTEHLPAAATANAAMCIVPNKYLYATSTTGLETASSIHLRFDYNETMFRYEMEFDGQPWLTSAITPENGNTFSAIVGLNAS